jgi:hypothetical protein
MLDKTFEAFSKTMALFEKEMKDLFNKPIIPPKGSKIKIKIKKGSTVIINGAKATLLDDVIVITDDPVTLMGKINGLRK